VNTNPFNSNNVGYDFEVYNGGNNIIFSNSYSANNTTLTYYISTNAGSSFSTVDVTVASMPNPACSGIACSENGQIILTNNRYPQLSTNGGSTWSHANINGGSDVAGESISMSYNGVYQYITDFSNNKLYASTDSGSSFSVTTITSPVCVRTNRSSNPSIDGKYVLISCSNGNVLVSSNNGSSFTTTTFGGSLYNCYISPSGQHHAVGKFTATTPSIYHNNNYGVSASWLSTQPIGLSCKGVYINSDLTIVSALSNPTNIDFFKNT
jgi:hypothetical protein